MCKFVHREKINNSIFQIIRLLVQRFMGFVEPEMMIKVTLFTCLIEGSSIKKKRNEDKNEANFL
jgi:hypothetical protein